MSYCMNIYYVKKLNGRRRTRNRYCARAGHVRRASITGNLSIYRYRHTHRHGILYYGITGAVVARERVQRGLMCYYTDIVIIYV